MPKLEQAQFDQLIGRIQSGDAQAAAEIVKLYEPEIRREIRLRLTDSRLRRTLDSTDISQSVFGNFFIRASLGQIDFDRPGQLLRLLSTMARNKVIDKHRREKIRRPSDAEQNVSPMDPSQIEPVDPGNSPSEIVAADEYIALFKKRLTNEEQKVLALRREGLSWIEIGKRMDCSAEALRKRLARSCERILDELGLNEPGIVDPGE